MAKSIKKCAISRLLVGAHYNFHENISNFIAETTAIELHVEELAAEYDSLIEKQLKLITQSSHIAYTEELAKLDNVRDRWVGQLFTAVDAAAVSPSPQSRLAGRQLRIACAPYRGISGNEYTKQTAILTGLTDVLSVDKLKPHIQTLGLAGIIENLEESNRDFNNMYNLRIKTESERPQFEISAIENRKVIDNIYYSIVETVNAFAIASPSQAINSFINKVNARIEHTRNIIAHQRAGGTGNERRNSKLNKAASRMSKTLMALELSKAQYEARLAAHERAKAEYEALL